MTPLPSPMRTSYLEAPALWFVRSFSASPLPSVEFDLIVVRQLGFQSLVLFCGPLRGVGVLITLTDLLRRRSPTGRSQQQPPYLLGGRGEVA